jgi:hypothetical protein
VKKVGSTAYPDYGNPTRTHAEEGQAERSGRAERSGEGGGGVGGGGPPPPPPLPKGIKEKISQVCEPDEHTCLLRALS